MIRDERFERWALRAGRSGDGGAEVARFRLFAGLVVADVELACAGVGLGCDARGYHEHR
jgi:hypothetical protein